jgi:multidrug efflux pump
MNVSSPFIARPIATTLLTIGVLLAGIAAFFMLPVSPLPQVDFPTISVQASLPGASPETMAATVATPLERALGRIAGVTEMTSSSSLGSTRIVLQFDLSRDINGAARDVQAAINAARNTLPTGLPSNPTYRKVNPADAPVMIVALTSDTMTRAQMYDAASTILAQRLSQVEGVGQVNVAGSALPAVRVELNPNSLAKYGIGFEDVRTTITGTNANRPKGAVELGDQRWQIGANDQARKAADYLPLIVTYRSGAPVRISDLGDVVDSVQDIRNAGSADGKPAVLLIVNRQPGANIIDTVDRVKALLPQLASTIPSAIDVKIVQDRTPTIRASLREVERALVIAFGLVLVVVFVFLRNVRAALIPSVAVPVSLVGTFGIMYLAGYSLDNLSLMALTVATGFVVDDAIVVLENVSRHIEAGEKPIVAALRGAREVGFTVLSMSISLVAVFIPILLMGGIVGRLFREFAVVLSAAILVSLLVSLTTTPMMCARLLKRDPGNHGRVHQWMERAFERLANGYARSLAFALDYGPLVVIVFLSTIALSVYLYVVIPKGFFPQQDTGRLIGGIQGDQSISFQAMEQKLADFVRIVRADPDVESVVAFTGGGQRNGGMMFVGLKPKPERKTPVERIIARLRTALAQEPGASLFLVPVQDIRIGGRQSNSQYQFTLQADDLNELRAWEPRIRQALSQLPELVDVNTDQQDKGLQTTLVIDRDTAARYGVTPAMIDTTLNDAFGQRQVSTIYNPLNQYKVVMEAAPQYWQSPEALKDIYIAVPASTAAKASGLTTATVTATSGIANVATATATNVGSAANASSNSAASTTPSSGASPNGASSTTSSSSTATTTTGSTGSGSPTSTTSSNTTAPKVLVPLAAISSYGPTNTRLSVNHQGQFAASTISFNLPPDVSLSDATRAIDRAMARLGVPSSVHGTFAGSAQAFLQSVQNQPILILTAILTIYIVLGVLYESYVHPLTILSTLPSAGVGALLALIAFGEEFSLMALIGVILLIGIVKKNGIMMIDFALSLERTEDVSPREAISRACALRFRPIMMTTMAALLGALPLALGTGEGAELRRPLGISIVGGLLVSQLLTLYTTPVIYLYLDRFRLWAQLAVRRSAAPVMARHQPGMAD